MNEDSKEKQTYTIKMDMYQWYDRLLEGCDIVVTGRCIEDPPYVEGEDPDIDILSAEIKDQSVLEYMLSNSINVKEVETKILNWLKDDPWEFVDLVAEEEGW